MDQVNRTSDDVRGSVRERYGRLAREAGGDAVDCCGSDDCCGGESSVALTHVLYDTPAVADLPVEVTGLSLGCGDPVSLAGLRPGETMLDLGSGGGIDCFLAAQQVGPAGHVIGVDMTAEMVERARTNARKVGLDNVEFRLGEIEHLPVADASVDVVISNCVINLVPDKAQVFREVYRVLRPGGRMAVSDMVARAALPPELVADPEAWGACIAGAMVDEEYAAAVAAAGFQDVVVEPKDLPAEANADMGPLATQGQIYSARIRALKPT
jgi:arsenite methyltransferase